MNVKLLRKVKRHILAEPKRLKMWSWAVWKCNANQKLTYNGKTDLLHRPFARCGTAACIAGWTCIVSGKLERGTVDPTFISQTATELLGLTKVQAERLFAPILWPNKFDGGSRDDGKKKTAEITAARIEHFIKTKGAE